MSTPDPEGMSMLAKVLTAAAAIFGPVGGLWLWIDSRFAKKHTVNNQLQAMKAELAVQRSTIGKIFDVIRENEQRAQDRHERLMERISERGQS